MSLFNDRMILQGSHRRSPTGIWMGRAHPEDNVEVMLHLRRKKKLRLEHGQYTSREELE